LGKTPLIVAPVIVALALLFLTFWLGKRFERLRKFADARGIDPDLYHEFERFARSVIQPPPSLESADVVVLPEATRKLGVDVLTRYDETTARRALVRWH
jgi:hypothetical protein